MLAIASDDGVVGFAVERNDLFRESIAEFAAIFALVEPPDESAEANTTKMGSVSEAEVEEARPEASETNEIEEHQTFEKAKKRRRHDKEKERLVIGVAEGDVGDDGEDEAGRAERRAGGHDRAVHVLCHRCYDCTTSYSCQVIFWAHKRIRCL